MSLEIEQWFIPSFIHSFIHSFVNSFIRPTYFVLQFIRSLIHPFVHLYVQFLFISNNFPFAFRFSLFFLLFSCSGSHAGQILLNRSMVPR